ncbi:nucleotidyltransferase family protein [Ichthyenterobacterium sp. W332]|uniref:Nucleotidyltransferase family protein n=1 Tax=Microcosmobacter mediterraneus TaxID=3075607 RepID=A0ABU2YQP9_9FLAO|nr:nucleotidyltransferase family protein [Ichthyenterobacterium sp. W332]MDT0559393.1 nucleotidyltransferase family protein [Ichthyenterobacterium sp. W332]
MSSKRHIIFTISDILSFTEDRNRLITELENPKMNWDRFVKIASQHLILPAIYCRLKHKQLLNLLPNDLIEYLEELTEINRNRNFAILEEAKAIAKMFNANSIDYVFLKGTAMLLGNYYVDQAERMIGDIDILVSSSDVENAQNILLNHNYLTVEPTLNSTYFNTKHLPRLISGNKIAAVEIHTSLFNNSEEKYIKTKRLLIDKIIMQHSYIPKQNYHLRHNIYNYQINDKGFYYKNPNLRSYYDTVILSKNFEAIDHFLFDDIIENYFEIGTLFFKDFWPMLGRKTYENKGLLIRLRHSWVQCLWMITLNSWKYILILLKRMEYFIFNNSYRKDLIKRCFRSHKL